MRVFAGDGGDGHRQRDAEEKEREEAERRLEAGRGRTTRAMGMTLKTTHCELGRRRPAQETR